MTDQPTIGEVMVHIRNIEDRMDRGFRDVKAQIAAGQYVTKDQYNPEHSEQNRRLNNLEDTVKWATRTAAAAAVAIVIEGVLLVLVARGGI